MTTEINGKGLMDWRSERFGKESIDTDPNLVYFEDDDPRIVLVEDETGEPCWVIGYSPKIKLQCIHDGRETVGGGIIVIRVRDYSALIVDPSSLADCSITL